MATENVSYQDATTFKKHNYITSAISYSNNVNKQPMVPQSNIFYSPPFLTTNFVSSFPLYKHSPATTYHMATHYHFQKKLRHHSPDHAENYLNITALEHVFSIESKLNTKIPTISIHSLQKIAKFFTTAFYHECSCNDDWFNEFCTKVVP